MKWKFLLLVLLLLIVVGCSEGIINKKGLKLHYERTFWLLDFDSIKLDCEDPFNGELCLLDLVTKSKNVTLCEQFEEGQSNFECYTRIAELEQNFSICHKQKISNLQQPIFGGIHIFIYDCYLNLIASKGDVKLCDKMFNETEGKVICYTEVAGVLADLKVCDKIKTVADKNNCYTWVAETLGDISICDKYIKDNYTKQFCYKNVALTINDTSICQKKVTFEDLRGYCGL